MEIRHQMKAVKKERETGTMLSKSNGGMLEPFKKLKSLKNFTPFLFFDYLKGRNFGGKKIWRIWRMPKNFKFGGCRKIISLAGI